MQVRKLILAASALTLSLAVGNASATLVNVKVGATATGVTQSGAAVLGSATSWWNNYQYSSSTPYLVPIVDDTNTLLSGVTLTIANSSGVGSITNSTGSPSFLMGAGKYQNAGGIWTVTLNGLLANTQYEFIGYSAYQKSAAPYGGTWAVITGTAGAGTFANDGSSLDITTGAGKAFADFIVTTDALGALVLTDTQSVGYVPFEGFQLSSVAAVPEPGSMLMMLCGGLVLLACGRKARA